MRNTCSICGSYAINIDKAGLLCDVHFYKVERDDLLEALRDMLSGWRYIRDSHGDLYGVGWDRAQEKAEKAISKAEGGAA